MQPGKHEYERAIRTLRQGGIVAYPTETFYGLAVDPKNAQAIKALYTFKKRDADKPVSLLIPSRNDLPTVISSCQDSYLKLMEFFWPGPLTLVFPASKLLSPLLTCPRKTVALRVSSHPVASKLCKLWGGALTATSANISGAKPLVNASDVCEILGGKLSYVLDGGKTPGGKGSTILHCLDARRECKIIRDGVIGKSDILKKLPPHFIICKS